ncbi:DNA-methyltransferase [Deinococcus reticulitermitis]|uniref:DNA-methyltransferase n=1 Tax=Deinococcus reticulitermitis TaxID=856736 RepID=UPI001C43181D|nr:site-specific DNA-methyltransferase [Deinococcus reticulitermitis]
MIEHLKTIRDNSFDLSVTSPPYNKRITTRGWLVRDVKYSHSDDAMPEEDYQRWQIEFLNEMYRVMKPGASLFYNHKLRWLDGKLHHPFTWISSTEWNIRQEIIWDRGIAANMRGWRFWQLDERIYWLYKPQKDGDVGKELLSKHAKMSSIWRFPPEPRKENHPAPFPLELPVRIISSMELPEGALVFDPFSGTGTSLVAAKLLGYSYYGIDISPDYVDYTRKRLRRSTQEAQQCKQEVAKHFVKKPFKRRKEEGQTKWPYRDLSEDAK